jgi:hypothetical protein
MLLGYVVRLFWVGGGLTGYNMAHNPSAPKTSTVAIAPNAQKYSNTYYAVLTNTSEEKTRSTGRKTDENEYRNGMNTT